MKQIRHIIATCYIKHGVPGMAFTEVVTSRLDHEDYQIQIDAAARAELRDAIFTLETMERHAADRADDGVRSLWPPTRLT